MRWVAELQNAFWNYNRRVHRFKGKQGRFHGAGLEWKGTKTTERQSVKKAPEQKIVGAGAKKQYREVIFSVPKHHLPSFLGKSRPKIFTLYIYSQSTQVTTATNTVSQHGVTLPQGETPCLPPTAHSQPLLGTCLHCHKPSWTVV